MLAVAAQRAFAMSLPWLPLATAKKCDGAEPPLAEVLADAKAIEPIVPSRLPAPGRPRAANGLEAPNRGRTGQSFADANRSVEKKNDHGPHVSTRTGALQMHPTRAACPSL